MTKQWDSSLYEGRHSFVWKYGAGLLPLLNAQHVQRILALGCGTAHQANEIASTGALGARGVTAKNTFFFPSVGEYAPLLERHGFEVRMAELFDRPTELEDPVRGMREWIEMFKSTWLDPLPKSEHPALFADVEERLRPHLFRNGHWHADYRRLRLTAYKL